MSELTSLARGIGRVSSAMKQIGVDVGWLNATASAFQLMGGTGEIIKGLIAAKQAYNVVRATEGVAQLAKYTVGAVAVAALAVAGGVAMEIAIDQAVDMHVPADDAGLRLIAGGIVNGR